MSQSDTEYYRRRAVDERAAALQADNADVAAIHQELARQYQALADQTGLRPKLRVKYRQRVSA